MNIITNPTGKFFSNLAKYQDLVKTNMMVQFMDLGEEIQVVRIVGQSLYDDREQDQNKYFRVQSTTEDNLPKTMFINCCTEFFTPVQFSMGQALELPSKGVTPCLQIWRPRSPLSVTEASPITVTN